MNTCYTVITGGYDELKPPKIISDNWQYVVFSDRHIESDIWDCIVTDKHNRDVKIRPHLEMFENLTLYVDGSIEIIGDLNQFITKINNTFAVWLHPHRSTVEQEIKAIIDDKGINKVKARSQLSEYIKTGFKDNMGLYACGVLLRDLSNPEVKIICDEWYKEYIKGVSRDQISLPYVFWKSGWEPDVFNDFIFNQYFIWGRHIR